MTHPFREGSFSTRARMLVGVILVGGLLVGMAPSAHAELTFEFTDDGTGNTRVRGSGSATITRPETGAVGYGGTSETFARSTLLFVSPSAVPSHLRFASATRAVFSVSGTLNVNGRSLDSLIYNSTNRLNLGQSTGTATFGGPSYAAGGETVFPLPFSNFSHLVGQQVDIFQDGSVILCFGPCPPTNQPPVCDAGLSQTVELTGVATEVTLDGTGSSDPDGDALSFSWSVPAGSGATILDSAAASPVGLFPLGETAVTLRVEDGRGGLASCNVTITVNDTSAPDVSCSTDVVSLWPPNHKMRIVAITMRASDLSAVSPGDLSVSCSVSSSEPDNAPSGDGNTTGDVGGQDGHAAPVSVVLTYSPTLGAFVGSVALRAERQAAGTGRTYTIAVRATDASGNVGRSACAVQVPRHKGKKK